MPETAKLTNVIVAGFGESCNLVRESKMFVKDEAEVSSRVGGVKWRVVYFDKLVFESDEQEFSLRGVESQKISSHPGLEEICWRADAHLLCVCLHTVLTVKVILFDKPVYKTVDSCSFMKVVVDSATSEKSFNYLKLCKTFMHCLLIQRSMTTVMLWGMGCMGMMYYNSVLLDCSLVEFTAFMTEHKSQDAIRYKNHRLYACRCLYDVHSTTKHVAYLTITVYYFRQTTHWLGHWRGQYKTVNMQFIAKIESNQYQ